MDWICEVHFKEACVGKVVDMSFMTEAVGLMLAYCKLIPT